jgi:hypothetical protein
MPSTIRACPLPPDVAVLVTYEHGHLHVYMSPTEAAKCVASGEILPLTVHLFETLVEATQSRSPDRVLRLIV